MYAAADNPKPNEHIDREREADGCCDVEVCFHISQRGGAILRTHSCSRIASSQWSIDGGTRRFL